MVEAKNFIEKELGKTLNEGQNTEQITEKMESVPTYTPPPPVQESIQPVPKFIQQPVIQIAEKIVYKKQRIHGFFRTLTIIALLAIGFLMLGESTGIISLSINNFKLHQAFPIVIILSTIIIRSYRGVWGKIFGLIIFLVVWGGIFTISVYTSLNPSSKRKEENIVKYELPQVDNKIKKNIYLETLIGNSYIKSTKSEMIESTRNSDRNLFVTSGKNNNITYIKLDEDNNRNLIQKYNSNINLKIPQKRAFNMIYIKNFLGLHTIDLTNIQRNKLKFHAGIGDITIKANNVLSGNRIEIQGAVANVEIDIPKDVGVIMYYKHLVGFIDTPKFDILTGHYFQSQNIKDAKAILNLYINLGVGNMKINRIEPKK